MTTPTPASDDPVWLRDDELRAWVRFIGVVELLPGVLDSQLQRDSGLNHFEYYALAILSEAPGRTLRMTGLATRANSTLPRLSHVVSRLEKRGLVARAECPEDRRAMNVTLTDAGWDVVVAAAPGHAAHVRDAVFATLTPQDVADLHRLSDAILDRIDPDGLRSRPYEG